MAVARKGENLISKQDLWFGRIKAILIVLFVLGYVAAIGFYYPVSNKSHDPIYFSLIFFACLYPFCQANYLYFVKERRNQERRAQLKKHVFTVNFGMLGIIIILLISVCF